MRLSAPALVLGVVLALSLTACGGDDEDSDGGDDGSAVSVTPPTGAPGTPGIDDSVPVEDVVGCLEDAGLDASYADGPPPRIDVSGEGDGAVYYLADLDVAADAARQLTDQLTGSGELLTGATGYVAYYYLGSSEESVALQACVAL